MDIYVNHATNDPRSAKAWLEGRDDGRVMMYSVFRKKALRRNPLLSDVEIDSLYRDAVRNGWVEMNRLKLRVFAGAMVAYAVFWTWYFVGA